MPETNLVAPDVFTKLVKNLSNEERRTLLQRLNVDEKNDLSEPLKAPAPEDVPEWQEVYNSYSLFKKLLIWIKGLFQGKDLATMVGDQMLLDLGSEIERTVPGMFTLRAKLAHPPFYDELKKLFDTFDPFRPLFQSAFGQDKQEFIAFLVGLEWGDIQDLLVEASDYQKVFATNPDRPTKEIKAIVDGNFRLILEGIAPERKKQLYAGLKSLYALRSLVGVRDDRILQTFMIISMAGQPGNAGLRDLRDDLTDLCEKLYLFSNPPPNGELEGLFLFHHQEKLENPEADLETPITSFLVHAQETWLAIREFHRKVPLLKLTAWLNNSPSWQPHESGGVEDWFSLYKRFWQTRLDRAYDVFAKDRQVRLVLSDIDTFLEISAEEFHKEAFYPDDFRGLLPTKGDITLTFLKHFMERVFVPKMNPVLKIVLLEGDFYKRNNRGVFTDGYNVILQIQDQLASFHQRFRPTGDWGLQIAEIRKKNDDENAIVEMKDIYLAAGDWVEGFLSQTIPVFNSFFEVLKGIAKGSTGGKFDTLANLNTIGGKANGVFRKEMENLVRKWEKLLQILRDVGPID